MIHNKQGIGYFLILFYIALIILFIGIFTVLAKNDFDKSSAPVIGEQQEGILLAHARAEGLKLYADNALARALDDTFTHPDPDRPLEEQLRLAFEAKMRQHPVDPVYTTFTVTRTGKRLTLTTNTDVVIPIDIARKGTLVLTNRQGNTDTPLTAWPVDSNEKVLTSLFGERNLASSPNTAGIDIRARPEGATIYAASDGTITHTTPDAPGGSDVPQVIMTLPSGMTCQYLHVKPTISVGTTVTAGQPIATAAAWDAGPHLDLRCYDNNLLTPQTAINTWGASHVKGGSAPVTPADTTYVVTSTLYPQAAYIDPFCLFTPTIQQEIIQYLENNPGHAATLSGLSYRTGSSIAEQLSDTCNAYNRATFFTNKDDATTTPPTTSDKVQRTLDNLEQRLPSGETLKEYIEATAGNAGIDPKLVIAMIVQESEGTTSATSGTGVRGIMQVTCPTARDTLGAGAVPNCNDLYEPALNIKAGTYYLADLYKRYADKGLSNSVAFAAAHYNGGGVVWNKVQDAMVSNSDPTYEDVMNTITWQDITLFNNQQEKEDKLEEMTNHGRVVAQYYAELGGSAVPLGSSRTTLGTYQFPITLEIDLSDDQYALLRDVEALQHANTPQRVAEVLSRGTLEMCGSYPEVTARTFAACGADMRTGSCSCVLPDPSNMGVEEAMYTTYWVLATQAGTDYQELMNWAGYTEDERPSITYHAIIQDDEGNKAPISEDHFTYENNHYILQEQNITAQALYIRQLAEEQLLLTNDTNTVACTPQLVMKYCSQKIPGYTFWQPHTYSLVSIPISPSNIQTTQGTPTTSAFDLLGAAGQTVDPFAGLRLATLEIDDRYLDTSLDVSRDGADIDMIIIHTTESAKGTSVDSLINNVFLPNINDISIHYIIDQDGTIYSFVDPKYRAYHAGESIWQGEEWLNKNSIGIELMARTSTVTGDSTDLWPITDEQYASLALLVDALQASYIIPDNRVLGHVQVAADLDTTPYVRNRRTDPGYDFNWGAAGLPNNYLLYDTDVADGTVQLVLQPLPGQEQAERDYLATQAQQ